MVTANSGAYRYSFEIDTGDVNGAAAPSVFTGALIEGLRTGDADRNGDGYVSINDLYAYIYDRVRESTPYQTPEKKDEIRGDLIIARNPNPPTRALPRLPGVLAAAVEHPLGSVRQAAAGDLAALLHGADENLALSARQALQALRRDGSDGVSAAAEHALARFSQAAEKVPQTAHTRDGSSPLEAAVRSTSAPAAVQAGESSTPRRAGHLAPILPRFMRRDVIPAPAARAETGAQARGPVGKHSHPGNRWSPRGSRRLRQPLSALLVIVVLAGGGIVGYRYLREYVIPPDYSGSGAGSVVVQVKQNQTAADVASTLFRLRVVASTRAFVLAAQHSSRPTALEPGFYRLHQHMKAALAFDLLLNPGARIQLNVTIPEGLRASQIVARLGAQSGIPLARYQAALADPAALGLPSYARNQPEGYLFPATYSVQPSMTATDVLRAMVKQFDAEAARINLVATARSVNLAPQEAVIVASLLQAEGGRVADLPKIARVIYNRLAINMRLQLDSTVMYALHRYGILATNQQLQVRSPYNTYQHTGLPPGPIDNPGDAAIQAALHPAVGNWVYFVTVNPKTGLTEFTSDPATSARLRAELAKNLGQGR